MRATFLLLFLILGCRAVESNVLSRPAVGVDFLSPKEIAAAEIAKLVKEISENNEKVQEVLRQLQVKLKSLKGDITQEDVLNAVIQDILESYDLNQPQNRFIGALIAGALALIHIAGFAAIGAMLG